ncbi:Cobyric acid synthase OS=Lysinibacillus sphaericus OX=1421 GN=cobQ PE=3 SV=1 [Lysinibacillus sphaericus]
MLGEVLLDPDAVEGNGESAQGLGLLPMETVFVGDKKTVQMSGTRGQAILTGYEIHLGRTKILRDEVSPFLQLADGRVDGAVSVDEQVIGTYFHGIFHNRTFTRQLVNEMRTKKGLVTLPSEVKSDAERRESAYNMLASHVRANLDMEKIYDMLKIEVNG